MPSLKYQLTERLIPLYGLKRMLSKDGEAFSRMVIKRGRKQSVKVPHSIDKKCNLSENKIGAHKYFVISKKNAAPQRAVLYLFGGGYVLPADRRDFLFVMEMAEEADAEVWFPIYPLLPRYKLMDAVGMVMTLYEKMLQRFPADKITFVGFSSGGALAYSVCIQNKQEGFRCPMPGKLILVSSGTQLPPSEAQVKEMERLAPMDPMIPLSFFQNIGQRLTTEEDRYLERKMDQAEKSQTSPYAFDWKWSFEAINGRHLCANFTKCGILELFRSLGIEELTPAMCAFDYPMVALAGIGFQREYTLASGGPVCDCHYIKKEK